MEKPQVPKTSLEYCLNCAYALESTDVFCASCGQRTRESRISVWQLIGEFFKSVLNIDSKFFKSIGLLFFPSRLTREYIQGKRRSFVNPSRFFFASLVIHFGLLALIAKDSVEIELGNGNVIEDIRRDVDHAEMYASFDSLILDYPLADSEDTDSLKQKLLGPKVDVEADSAFVIIFGEGNREFGSTFSKVDLIKLNSNEFVEKYGDDSFWDKILARQVYRFYNDSKGAQQFILGNLLWVIVFLALFTAFFLKILYIRRRYFLVDHLTLSLFMHSFLLITLSCCYIIGFGIFGGKHSPIVYVIIVNTVVPLYALLSIKRYYNQGWIKTILKFLLLSFYQLIILGIFVVIVGMVSLLIF